MSLPTDIALVVEAGRLMAEGKSEKQCAESMGINVRYVQWLRRKARALSRMKTAPRPYAYKLAAFDPVVARALDIYEALR